jgi:hypothetical protein
LTGEKTHLGLLRGKDFGVRIASAYLLGMIGAVDVDSIEEIIKAAESTEPRSTL